MANTTADFSLSKNMNARKREKESVCVCVCLFSTWCNSVFHSKMQEAISESSGSDCFEMQIPILLRIYLFRNMGDALPCPLGIHAS
jgi:hypothetical protein